MRARRESEIFENYKIVRPLWQTSFSKIYLVSDTTSGKTLFLVDWDKGPESILFQKEAELWSSSWEPFPRVLQKWDDPEQSSFLVAQFQAICVLKWGELHFASLSEKERFALLSGLSKVFQSVCKSQIDCEDVFQFAQRIFHTLDQKVILLPAPLQGALQTTPNPILPLKNAAQIISPAVYIRSLGKLLAFLLTGALPTLEKVFAAPTNLGVKWENLLLRMNAGIMTDFDALDVSLLELRPKRRIDAEPQGKPSGPLKTAHLPARKRILAKRRAWVKTIRQSGRKIANLAKGGFGKFVGRAWKAVAQKTQSRRLPDEDMLHFIQSLSVMLGCGIALDQALKTLHKQTENVRFKQSLRDLESVVAQKGRSLSFALQSQPDFFPEHFVNMVNAGETHGKLSEALRELALYSEREFNLRKKIKSASVYPAFVGTGCLALLAVFFYFVLPKVLTLGLGESGVVFPLPTRILMHVVSFTHSYWMAVVFLLLILASFPLRSFYRSEKGKDTLDTVKLKIPVFGDLYKKLLLTRFCSTMGAMLRSGVQFTEALDVAGRVPGSQSFYRLISGMKERVTAGDSFAKAVMAIPFYPRLFGSMVEVGEQSGALDQILVKTSNIYELEVDEATEKFLGLFEPMLVVLMGFVVGFVVLALFLPAYSIISSVSP